MKLKELFSVIVLLCFVASVQAAGIQFDHLSLAQAKAKAKKENKLIFIDVYATWCGPCKWLSKSVFPDAELGEYYNANFVSLKIDGEKGEGPDMMNRFDLGAYPSLLFLDADGNLLKKVEGGIGADQLLSLGKGVANPEETDWYKAKQEFDAGNRDLEFLEEYTMLLMDNDEDPSEPVAAYLKAKPSLDLDEEMDVYMFYVGVTDISHPAMPEFISRAEEMEEEYGIFMEKAGEVLIYYLEQSAEMENPDMTIKALRKLYPGMKAILGDELPSLETIEEDLMLDYNMLVEES